MKNLNDLKLSSHIKEAIASFEAEQERFSGYGARDTEPDRTFHAVIHQALDDRPFNPAATGGWSLYDKPGFGDVAEILTEKAKAVYDAIKAPATSTFDAMDLIEYAWRIGR